MRPSVTAALVIFLGLGLAQARHLAPRSVVVLLPLIGHTTFGGPVTIDEAERPVAARAFGGDIRIGTAESRVRAISFGGDVRLDAARGDVRATAFGGDVVVRMDEESRGRRELVLRSYGGDVTLWVPQSASLAVDVRLAYRRGEEGRYRIESDFDLTRHERGWHRDWMHLWRPVRTVTATGAVAGGRDRVRVRVEGGNVFLRRESI
jgi:hypothetical protein